MNHKEHLTLEGLQKILAIKSSLNLGLSVKEIKTNFPNINTIERPLVTVPKIIDPNWFSGFTSGDFFHVPLPLPLGEGRDRIKNSTKSKLGVQVSLLFKMTPDERDKELMKSFINYFPLAGVVI